MVLAVGIQDVSARFLSVVTATPAINVPEARMLTAINFPSKALNSTQADIGVVVRQTSPIAVTQADTGVVVRQTSPISVPEARILVAARGRVANPQVRAWTFSLDGHDHYVLRLGDFLTLVYDTYSEQWVDWQDWMHDFWRPNIGTNWIGAAALADTNGSSVVVGDDTWGLLWFLDPNQPYDEHPDYLAAEQELYFERIVMGQMAIRGREVLPCYAAWLTTDMGLPAYDGAGVTLYSSDDAGVTFDDHGYVTVTPGENTPELSWYSLGQIAAPGRLFKIVDDGAIARIDGMEMNDPDDK